MNLKLLEDKYWSAKDADFSVVQNRTFTKDSRFFITGAYGVLVNDPYSYGRVTDLTFGYYFSERWGVEISDSHGHLTPNDSVTALTQYNGLRPNYNKFVSDTSLNLIWVPFYAKMSFMNSSIVYFDMQFAAGLGNLTYEQQISPTEGPNTQESTTAYNFDFTQQLFFSNHFALRLDLKNKWSSEHLDVYQLQGSQYSARNALGTHAEQDTTLTLGITYFFGSGSEGKRDAP